MMRLILRPHMMIIETPQNEGDEAHKQEIHPGFETQRIHHQKSKTWISVAPQKGLMSSKFFSKSLCGRAGISLHA